ncbi:probable nucleoredoxin 1 [Fagus crenata]
MNSPQEVNLRLCKHLQQVLLKAIGIFSIVILDLSRKVLCENGFKLIEEYGIEGYPFSQQRIKEIEEQETAARKEQSLSLMPMLVLHPLDFVITNDDQKVPISELEGKIVGLYFFSLSYKTTEKHDFYCEVINLYENLKKKGVSFEVVLVPLDITYHDFKKHFGGTQWFSVPYKGKCHEKLARVFEKYGYNAFPFTSQRYLELAGMIRARVEELTLESVLISWEKDFVINKDGAKMVNDNCIFHVLQIPMIELLVYGYPCCHSSWTNWPPHNKESKRSILLYGADAYPFTDEHLLEVQEQIEEMTMDWPRKVKHALHGNHDLVLQHIREYGCKECRRGVLWTYCCQNDILNTIQIVL